MMKERPTCCLKLSLFLLILRGTHEDCAPFLEEFSGLFFMFWRVYIYEWFWLTQFRPNREEGRHVLKFLGYKLP
jgi:hypothetical protein